jgi:hypothetical protein
MSEKIFPEKNLVVRHNAIELIEHWAIAVSGLLLLITGIFELPVAKRYYIITVPGLGWSASARNRRCISTCRSSAGRTQEWP